MFNYPIELYYDGVDIKNNSSDLIKGFTTNISFLKQAGISDYDKFIKESLLYSKNRPISFQLYDDDDDDIEKTATRISSYDSSIYVKIPVIKTTGKFNTDIISKLHKKGLQINVTAIFTKDQIDSLKDCFDNKTNVIISVFGGRVNDSGLDCTDLVKYAVDSFKNFKNIKILWAACRTIYNIIEANNQNAHIVTVPESVLSRLYRLNQSPAEASLETVNTFKKDGIDSNIKFYN
jgi:transaldolase